MRGQYTQIPKFLQASLADIEYIPILFVMNKSGPSSIQALHRQWHAFALLLIACAQNVSRAQESRRRQAWVQADMLELWVRSGLAQLTWQIHGLDALEETLSPEDEEARLHLSAVAYSLLMLALFLQYLKLTSVRRAGGPIFFFQFDAAHNCASNPLYPLGFQDSG